MGQSDCAIVTRHHAEDSNQDLDHQFVATEIKEAKSGKEFLKSSAISNQTKNPLNH